MTCLTIFCVRRGPPKDIFLSPPAPEPTLTDPWREGTDSHSERLIRQSCFAPPRAGCSLRGFGDKRSLFTGGSHPNVAALPAGRSLIPFTSAC